MKITWEENDIYVGRRIGSFAHSEQLIVGYVAEQSSKEPDRYTIVSLTDGMVNIGHTKASIAKILTDGNYVPVELLNEKG